MKVWAPTPTHSLSSCTSPSLFPVLGPRPRAGLLGHAAVMLFLNSLCFVLCSVLLCLPRVQSPGSGAKKQGEDLADNDGDEDEGIWGLQGGGWCMAQSPSPLSGEKPRLSVCLSVGVFRSCTRPLGCSSIFGLVSHWEFQGDGHGWREQGTTSRATGSPHCPETASFPIFCGSWAPARNSSRESGEKAGLRRAGQGGGRCEGEAQRNLNGRSPVFLWGGWLLGGGSESEAVMTAGLGTAPPRTSLAFSPKKEKKMAWGQGLY